MKSALNQLFTSHSSKQPDEISVKLEEAFYDKRYNQQYDKKNKMHTIYHKSNLLIPIKKW